MKYELHNSDKYSQKETFVHESLIVLFDELRRYSLRLFVVSQKTAVGTGVPACPSAINGMLIAVSRRSNRTLY